MKQIQSLELHKDTACTILKYFLEILNSSPEFFHQFQLKNLMIKLILQILTKYFKREEDIIAQWPLEIFKITIHIIELSTNERGSQN